MLRILGIPGKTVRLQRGEIVQPRGFLFLAQLIKILPAIDAGVVHIVEIDPDCVVANRLHRHDANMPPSGDHFLLAPPLIITKEQIDEMIEILRDALDAFAREAGLPVLEDAA